MILLREHQQHKAQQFDLFEGAPPFSPPDFSNHSRPSTVRHILLRCTMYVANAPGLLESERVLFVVRTVAPDNGTGSLTDVTTLNR